MSPKSKHIKRNYQTRDISELALKVANDVHNGYNDGELEADLREVISWWATRYALLATAARSVEGAGIVLEACARRDDRIAAKIGRELMISARKKLDKILNT